MPVFEPNLDRFNDDAFRYMERIIPRTDYDQEPNCQECGKVLTSEDLQHSSKYCRECKNEIEGEDA